ncbi:hypothetical protein AC249_AIPGENE18745 [Exaiptasia diaphana]|nr:hypothetical protein AC249_AIPGENE18745 [Exaiptasia diaphana]
MPSLFTSGLHKKQLLKKKEFSKIRKKEAALTATANADYRKEIKDSVGMRDPVVVDRNPDRPNLFLSVHQRPNTGEDKVVKPLEELANELKIKREEMPRTLVYGNLEVCGDSYEFFSSVLGPDQLIASLPDVSAIQSPNPVEPVHKLPFEGQLREELLELRMSLAPSVTSLGISLTTGFSLSLVDETVKKFDQLNSAVDIENELPIFNHHHAALIWEVIQKYKNKF